MSEDVGFGTADADSGARVEVRVLKRQGKSIRAIARELGLSHVTMRRYLRKPGAQRYGPRKPRPTKLDPHIASVLLRVQAARAASPRCPYLRRV